MNKETIIKSYAHDFRDMKMSEDKIEKMLDDFLEDNITLTLNNIERIKYNSQAEGCGLEDKGITDRYESMKCGWNQAMKAVKNLIDNQNNYE
ncbi:MAG: hypothetical protein KAS78_02150 [Candidatus Pacebacteria bacterium]|nr:hypothetical protein [Candidatus Paceibacterota bacterium]